ncbi:hypothetical protein [Streptomyces sp. A0592]|uniref:hypothetical protein n=1 Tax=Streptomyces sp. A0592 TaxID=2563099 RepID=UPI00109EDBAC|nr:hypothetical protein [Streptomyces sp. A0592]THA82754.1 hypothetical protein E6U81_19620 [Streptomyces sp. A0592]
MTPSQDLRAAAWALTQPQSSTLVAPHIAAPLADLLTREALVIDRLVSLTDGPGFPADEDYDRRNTVRVARAILAQPAEPRPEPEHCVHSAAIHQQHHTSPVTGCPWCTSPTTRDVPTGGVL